MFIRFDKLFIIDAKVNRKPHVCCVCDEILIGSDQMESLSLKKMVGVKTMLSWSHVPDERRKEAIEEYYKFDVESTMYPNKSDLKFSALANMDLISVTAEVTQDDKLESKETADANI